MTYKTRSHVILCVRDLCWDSLLHLIRDIKQALLTLSLLLICFNMKFPLLFLSLLSYFLNTKSNDLSNKQLIQTTVLSNGPNATYGVITGYASTNVPAYSNGNDSYTSDDDHVLHGIFMGMKWQCVEYARRWLFIRKSCVFDSIEGAADMWVELNMVQRVVDGQCFALKQHLNGSPDPPKNESLLIYTRSGSEMPFGHVAVIVDVSPGFIRVAEENYDAYYWSGNYSRQIPYVLINGSYYIEDHYPIFGWMSVVDDSNQLKPLDQSTIDAIIQLNETFLDFTCPKNGISHSLSATSYLFILVLSTLST